MPERFLSRIQRLLAPKVSQETVEKGLEDLGAGPMGQALADCTREQAEGSISEDSLNRLEATFNLARHRWSGVEAFPEHDGHRDAMNMLFRDAAKMLADNGRLK